MNLSKKIARTKLFQIFASFLLIFSMLTSAIPPSITFAADGDHHVDGHGSVKNDEGEIDYEEATINKEVSHGNKPGEYFIDLTVKGKHAVEEITTDIVIVYDNSNSMNAAMENGETRAVNAKEATRNFLNGLSSEDANTRFALVTYGSSIFDGQMNQTWASNPGVTANHSYKEFTNNTDNIINQLPSYVPSDSQHSGTTWHGGTFTQQALVEAGNLLSTSNADRKFIVTVTDGAPTLSYVNGYNNSNQNINGNGTSFNRTNMSGNHGTPTISTADELKQDYDMYAIGLGLSQGDAGASPAQTKAVVEGISTAPDQAYLVETVDEMVEALTDISEDIQTNSIVDGSINDPITDEFILPEDPFGQAGSENLEDGEFHLSASEADLLETVQVRSENQHILVDGLNLGADEWVKVRYKVQIDTHNEDLDPSKLYKTNGTTELTPNGNDPDNKKKFPEPEASADPIKVSGSKIWVDYGYEEYRPDTITLQLIREIKGEDRVIEEVEVEGSGDVWEYEFKEAVVYDNNGDKVDYKIREILPEGIEEHYVTESGSVTGESVDVRNILANNAKIELVKTAKSTSEHGENVIETDKDINYTFEITNTGNLPLKDISLEDELDGISAIEYETLNGDPITGDIKDVVMDPGDTIVATATYEVTQEDFDHGQVDNHAEVVGTPTVPNPEKFEDIVEFDDTPVKDDDDAAVPGDLDAEISLTKTADKEKVTEVGETVEYAFDIENTGNTTLTEVTLDDPMLGGEIKLDVDTLKPGETTTVTVPYEVTQEDINNGEIVNKADVEGTPPPAYTENPDNPDKVKDEDDEIVEADQSSQINLEKEANKDNLIEGEKITYTFTATNTGNTTLTNVEITDILDGISDTEYLTVNGDASFDQDNITLEPGDVLVAEATYVVTQDDVDTGQVFNEATVTGIDPKEDEVTDKDDESVPSEVKLGLELVKTSDKEYVTAEDQEIEYTFEVTNTSNVTLKDVEVLDEMLKEAGVDVEIDETTLPPGESTTGTATYTVTKEDIEAGVIENLATATGTPPNPNEEPPTSPPAENEVPVAQIELDKSVSPDVYTKVDQELTYTLVVTNTGEVTLNEVTLTDDMLGGEITLDVDTLEPGEKTTVTVPYTITEADVEAGEVLNTATTEGTPEGYDPEDPNTPGKVEDEDDAEAKYAALALEKTSDKEEVEEAGDEITYTFEVTNVGKTVINDIVVNDDMLAELDIDVELEETTLAAGESTTGTAVYTVTQEDIDNGGVYNVATTTGETPGDPEEPPVSPPDEEYVPSDRNPSIELEKSTETEEYTEVGQEIEYLFTVKNTGNTTLNDVKVDDETFKMEIVLSETTLAPGESTTGTYTHRVTQADLDNGDIHNFANTEGTPPPVIDPEDPENPVEQDPVTDEDDEKVPGKINKDLELTKEADKQEVEKAGEEITYTLTVTNTGNVTLDDVTVNDEMLGGDLEVDPSKLAPGETGTVTGTYTVTQNDIDRSEEIVNIATATGTPPVDPEDPPVTPPVEEKVPVEDNPKITLVKQADKERLIEGETITYTFTATNTGNTTLNKVNLVDELEGLSDIDYLKVNDNTIEDADKITLTPGDVLVAEATYVVTQADVDANEVYNEAIVEGTPPAKDNPEDPENPVEQDPVTDEDDEKVPSEHKPELALEKSTQTEEVTEVGQVITYNFEITNIGNVTIDNIKVDDEMLEDAGIEIVYDKTKLAPGESTVATADYTVTQEDIDNEDKIENIATSTGTPPNPEDPPVETPPSEEEVPVIKTPEIAIEKTAEEDEVVEAGDTITYNFVVTNTGNVTLDNVKVDDPMLEEAGVEIELEQTTLASGESTTGTAVYTVTQADIDEGFVYNKATSTGTPPGYDPEDPPTDPEDPNFPPVSPPDEVEVPAEQDSQISLVKEADKKEVSEAGEKVTYTFTVTNTGNVTLDDVKVYDETFKTDVNVEKTKLAPGESTTGTLQYVVTQDDIDNDGIHNVAITEGTPPNYDPEDPDSEKPTDKDNEKVFNKKNPSISLEKTSDTEKITKVDQEVTYTFVLKNTGNTTLSDVVVDDPMLEAAGIEVELNKSTLRPGEEATGSAVYKATQKDLEKAELVNIATGTGTPPGYDPDDPESPQKPTDKDKESIPVEKPGKPATSDPKDPEKPVEGEKLPKTATEVFNLLAIGLGILLIGFTVLFLSRKRKEDA